MGYKFQSPTLFNFTIETVNQFSYNESWITTGLFATHAGVVIRPLVFTNYPPHRRSYKETIYKIVNNVNFGV